MTVKVVTGGVPPKKTKKAEEEIVLVTGLKSENIRFVHTHKRNLTEDELGYEVSRGGATDKIIIVGCSTAVTQKILKFVKKTTEIVTVKKPYELIPV